MFTAIDQRAYLQKYLQAPLKDKKKKKKKGEKRVIKGNGFKIIDDDLDLSKLRALDTDELDIYGEGEDAPQVAGIIDDRPEELRKLEQFKTSTKWRVINQDDGFESKIQIEEIKQSVKEVEKENEIIFGKMYSDSEDEKEKDPNKQNNDSDASPPRKNASKAQNNDSLPRSKTSKKQYDSDVSPPRKSRKQSDSDTSPPRRNTNKKQSDDSSIRNKACKKQYDSDVSPPRKSGKQSDSDTSPPRKHTSKKQCDDSSARNKASKKQYESDASPPRKSKKQSDDRQKSRKQKQNDDSSASPPRRQTSKNHKDSPPRKSSSKKQDHDRQPRKRDRSPRRETNESRKKERTKKPSRWGDFEFEKNEVEMISQEFEKKKAASPKRHDSDESPPRKRDKERSRKSEKNRNKSDSDQSPPRKDQRKKEQKRKYDSDSDLSPQRKNRSKNRLDSPPPSNKKMAKTLDGKLAGLQDAGQLRMENDSFRRREEEVFSKMADEVSGRNAQVVSRKGKRDTSEDRNKQREKAERQKEIDDKYKKWSRGLKQIEDHQERMQDFMHEASKPLARHKGDKDLESRLKDVERAGDPMLQYIRDKKREAGELPPERPSYKGSFPPNRFNIRPGYRWDGVDRSNGYEKKYFEQQNKRKAQEEEAYKWSTEDL